jgi:polyisoprenoid-binding protein YceI
MAETSGATTATQDVQVPEAGIWEFDKAHTSITIKARHMMVTTVRGQFKDLSGTIHVAERPEDSWVEATIQAASIDTGDPRRDDHMRSADFMDVATYPTITYRSTGVEVRGETRLRVTGDLTVHGITKPIQLDVAYQGRTKSPWGQDVIAFTAEGEMDREEFGMTWNQALETGGFLVGKKLKFEIEVEAIRAKDESA